MVTLFEPASSSSTLEDQATKSSSVNGLIGNYWCVVIAPKKKLNVIVLVLVIFDKLGISENPYCVVDSLSSPRPPLL